MTSTCPRPHRDGRERPTAPSSALCRGCGERLGRNIAALPELDADLELALIQPDQGGGERVTHRRDPGLVINAAAVEARTAIRQQLAATVRMVADERDLTALPVDSVPGMSSWLAGHVPWLSAHEAAEEWAREYRELARAARAAAYPSGARRWYLSPCVEPECPGGLTVTMRADDDLLPSVIACDVDPEHGWEPHEWIALGRRLHGDGHVQLVARLAR